MKKLLLCSAFLWALGSTPAQAQAPAVAVVTIWYTGVHSGTGHLLVNRDGKQEVTEFEAGSGSKVQLEQSERTRSEMLRKVVAQLYQEGYQLKTSFYHEELLFVKSQ